MESLFGLVLGILFFALLFIGPITVLVVVLFYLFRRGPKPVPVAEGEPSAAPSRKPVRSQWVLAGLLGALIAGALFYRCLETRELQQSAALFIGLPGLLAVLLALSPRAGTLYGMVTKGMTIALLASIMFAWEGYICVLMAAPLFYLVGLLVAWLIETFKGNTPAQCSTLLLLAVMGLEGVSPGLTLPSMERVTVTREVRLTAADISAALDRTPDFSRPLPPLLQIGFPVPLGAEQRGSGLDRTLTVHFGPGEGRPPGDLVLRQTRHKPAAREFTAVRDTSHIRHWLTWDRSEVAWRPVGPDRQAVTWTLHFRRDLAPAWYFAPIERFFVRQSAAYLLDATLPGAARNL